MPILGFSYFGKPCIDFCQIESISKCKYISYMADLLDFRLSPKMHIKIKVFMGFLPKYTGMCKIIALFYFAIFMSVALIVVENMRSYIVHYCC